MAEVTTEKDLIRIHFEGGLADEGRVSLPEFVESLEGWQRFLEITASTFVQGRLTLDSPKGKARPRFDIAAVREGTVTVDIVGWLLWFGDHAANGLITAGELAAFSALWKWRKSLFTRQIRSRRNNTTIEEAAAGLEALARENGIVPGPDDDPVKVTESVDRSIKRALRPVKTSVTRVTVMNTSVNIQITAAAKEKSAIENDYAEISHPEEIKEVEEREVVIREIDVDKGTASFHFANPRDDDEQGIKRGRIVDPRILRARDPYTGSLHLRQSMRLYVQKKLLNSNTRAVRWELGLGDRDLQLELFGNK